MWYTPRMDVSFREKLYTKALDEFNVKGFTLSPVSLKSIHNNLFKESDYRDNNLCNENNITYADCLLIPDLLSYEFSKEQDFEYGKVNSEKRIEHISYFVSHLFQIHPFNSGNTLTIYVLTLKYLRYLGYGVDFHITEDKLDRFKEALIKSIYTNESKGEIKSIDSLYILLKKYTNTKSIQLNDKEAMVYELLKKDETSTIDDMAYLLEYSNRSIAYAMQSLTNKGLIERVGSKKNGIWRVKDGRN